jgi:hypothetical protein
MPCEYWPFQTLQDIMRDLWSCHIASELHFGETPLESQATHRLPWDLLWFSSDCQGKCRGQILKQVTTASVHIFCDSAYINQPVTRRYISPLLVPGLFFSSVIFLTQMVGPLEPVMSSSQGRYLHTGRHKHRINAHTDIHALSGIQTHYPSVRATLDGIQSQLLRASFNTQQITRTFSF